MAEEAIDPTSDYRNALLRLWSSGRSQAGPFQHSQIAEVAFFSDGFVQDWFFSSCDGTLRRKSRQNQNTACVLAHFLRRADPRGGGVVAVAVFQPRDALVVSVHPMDAALIEWLLDDAGPALKRREPLRALLLYRRPRGDHDAVLRYDWREKISDWEMRRSRAPILSGAPLWLRLTTHGPAMAHSERERYVPAAALLKCNTTCTAIAARLLSRTQQEGSLRVVADFRLLSGGRVELIWASFPPSDVAIPSAHFPASMPVASLRRPADPPPLQSPPLRPGDTSPTSAQGRAAVRGQAYSRGPQGRGGDSDDSEGSEGGATSGAQPLYLRGYEAAGLRVLSRPASARGEVRPRLLIASKLFLCPGCGKIEPVKLSLQPQWSER